MRAAQTVEDVARMVHRDLAQSRKYARMQGKSGFEGRHVGRGHHLADGDIVERHPLTHRLEEDPEAHAAFLLIAKLAVLLRKNTQPPAPKPAIMRKRWQYAPRKANLVWRRP